MGRAEPNSASSPSSVPTHDCSGPVLTLRVLPLVLLLGFAVSTVYAQGVTTITGVSVFRYAEPGTATEDIRVWGAVSRPGIYQVEPTTDLLTLLTLAGGPLVVGEDDRTIREVDVRVFREPEGVREIVLDASLEDLLDTDIALPNLQDGDLVSLRLRSQQRFTWRDALSIATTVGTAVLLGLRISEAL